jgi:membrane associated rhomboid family serine protease
VIPLRNDIPVRRTPAVTWALLAANALAFAWQAWFALSIPGVPFEHGINYTALVGGAIPYEVMTFRDIGPRDLLPPPLTIFSAMFLHGGLLHLGGNLLFLWVFGPNVEDVLGRVRFLGFYVASGVAAAVAQTLLSVAAGDPLVPMVGASGAIAGVMGAYVVFFPRARVLTAVPIFVVVRFVHLPAAFFAFVGGSGSGVAFFAHVGGFVFGWLVTKVLVRAQTQRLGPTW